MWIQTYGNSQYHYLKTNDVELSDVARSLAMQPRYLGHSEKHYSIAEHSIHIANYLFKRGGPDKYKLAMAGLLHDAHEAYIGDIPSPLKAVLGKDAMDSIRRITHKVDADVVRCLGAGAMLMVEDLHHMSVKEADMRILLDEKAAIWPDSNYDWGLPEGLEPLGVDIVFMKPLTAEASWLGMYRHIRRNQ